MVAARLSFDNARSLALVACRIAGVDQTPPTLILPWAICNHCRTRGRTASRRAFQPRCYGGMHSVTERRLHFKVTGPSVSYAFDFSYAMEFVVPHLSTFNSSPQLP
jgi:hypothetical protein